MGGAALILDALTRVQEAIHKNLKDLTPEDLIREPHPPIGWLTWHLARVHDSAISGLIGEDQIWISQGWHKKFTMPPDPKDFGPANTATPEQIAAFRAPSTQLLLEYHDGVLARTKKYLEGLTDKDLDRVLNEPRFQPLPTVGARLVSAVYNSIRRAGQIEYLVRLLRQDN